MDNNDNNNNNNNLKLNDFPQELLCIIFGYIHLTYLPRIARTCKQFSKIFKNRFVLEWMLEIELGIYYKKLYFILFYFILFYNF